MYPCFVVGWKIFILAINLQFMNIYRCITVIIIVCIPQECVDVFIVFTITYLHISKKVQICNYKYTYGYVNWHYLRM